MAHCVAPSSPPSLVLAMALRDGGRLQQDKKEVKGRLAVQEDRRRQDTGQGALVAAALTVPTRKIVWLVWTAALWRRRAVWCGASGMAFVVQRLLRNVCCVAHLDQGSDCVSRPRGRLWRHP